MQLTETQATCPLCKHPTGTKGANSEPTRLCVDCQRIVQTIRSTGNARVGVIEAPQAHATPPDAAIPFQAECAPALPALAEEERDAFEEEEPTDEPHFLSFNDSADPEPSLLDFDELFDDGPSLTTAAQVDSSLIEPFHDQTVLPASAAVEDAIPQPALQPSFEAYAGEEPPAAITGFADAIQDPSEEISEGQSESDLQAGPGTNGLSALEFFGDEVVSDHVEEPTRWNDAATDFPMLVEGAGRGKLATVRLPLVAALLVSFGLAGYFVIYRPSIQASQSGQSVEQIQPFQPTPVSAEQYAASQALSLPGIETKEGGTPPQADYKNSQSAVAANRSLEGHYALQAAAFPNEAGANEFCERLKRAGVPAYVVSAEIAGRGRWFRVRVGRFESAADADRFASEARLRARTSGLNLQLIVSSYDKP